MDDTPTAAPDPAERWRRLPEAPRAEDWISEYDVNPVPGSISNRSPLTDGSVLYGNGDVDGGSDGD